MGLIKAVGSGPIALDTCIFIYFIEDHPDYAPLLEPLFEKLDSGALRGVTSELTLLEALVVPYRSGNRSLATEYERTLSRGRGLALLPLDRGILRGAAWLRAVTSMRTPDALQVAAALAGGATAFLTNDRMLPEIPGLDVLQLGDFGRNR